jgi:hypothetical protein
MGKGIVRWLLLSTLFMAAGSAGLRAEENQYYRWLDDRGNPVHSDRPPPAGTPYEVVSTRTTTVRPVGSSAPTPAAPAPTGGDAVARAGTQSAAAATPRDPERCRQARENLETLDTAPRIRMRGDDGEFRYITDEEREQHRQTALSIINAHCDKPD